MNKRKYNKNSIKKLITIFIILLIILIAIYFSNPIVIAQFKIKSMNNSKLNDKMKIPEYMSFLIGLDRSEVLPESIIKYYNNFAENLIPKYHKKCATMSLEEINKYFNKNKNLIEIELGITEEERFSSFINTLKKLNKDEFILEKYYILDSTLENNKNKIIAYLGIKYENCEDIFFRTVISKRYQDKKSLITFDTKTDSEKIENGIKKLEEREEEIKNTESPFTRGSPIE